MIKRKNTYKCVESIEGILKDGEKRTFRTFTVDD